MGGADSEAKFVIFWGGGCGGGGKMTLNYNGNFQSLFLGRAAIFKSDFISRAGFPPSI